MDGLLDRGISPLTTLYHWDLPQALQDRDGWENRDSADWFSDYATVVFAALGDRVLRWLTINEAKIIAQQGYQYGRMAPGKSDLRASGTFVPRIVVAATRPLGAALACGLLAMTSEALRLKPLGVGAMLCPRSVTSHPSNSHGSNANRPQGGFTRCCHEGEPGS